MSYVLGWMGLVVISLLVSLISFVWAAHSGQFAEQQRLRYLPLCGQTPAAPPGDPARLSLEVYMLIIIGAAVVMILLVAAFLALAK